MVVSSEEEIADILLDTGAVTFSPSKPYRYASGILGPIYCDNRVLLSFPKQRSIIRDHFIAKLKSAGIDPDAVCGIATAGISWAALIAEALGKPMAYVRSDKKSHGKENKIEGKLSQGSSVLMVEDLVTTGGSSLAGVETVRGSGCVVSVCAAIFWYETSVAKNAFETADCRLLTLTSFSCLVRQAKAMGVIDDAQVRLLLDWNSDPQGWGARHGFV